MLVHPARRLRLMLAVAALVALFGPSCARGDQAEPEPIAEAASGACTPGKRVLWTNGNKATVRALDDDGNELWKQSYTQAGWTPLGLGGNRLLWKLSDGSIAIWKLDACGKKVGELLFNQPSGLVPQDIADAEPADDSSEEHYVLWSATPPGFSPTQAHVTLLRDSGTMASPKLLGQRFGHTPVSFGRGVDGDYRLLWQTSSGTARLDRYESLNGHFGFVSTKTYDVFQSHNLKSYAATSFAARLEGAATPKNTLLFSRTDGQAALFRLDASDNLVSYTSLTFTNPSVARSHEDAFELRYAVAYVSGGLVTVEVTGQPRTCQTSPVFPGCDLDPTATEYSVIFVVPATPGVYQVPCTDFADVEFFECSGGGGCTGWFGTIEILAVDATTVRFEVRNVRSDWFVPNGTFVADVCSGAAPSHGWCDAPCDSGCPVDECTAGSPLTSQSCTPCATTVCAEDEYCCQVEWDEYCVEHAIELCGSCSVVP